MPLDLHKTYTKTSERLRHRPFYGGFVLNGLDLFSGIGGLTLALSPWVEPLAYCENDRFAQAVLLSRMRNGEISTAPIWDDVTTLIHSLLPRHEIDIIYGGFPCQDISVAGAGAGLAGERSGLFFEIARLVGEIRPRFVFLENVPAITVRGLDRVAAAFSTLRYDCRWGVLSAFDVGAPHLRERWFLLARNTTPGWTAMADTGGKRNKPQYRSLEQESREREQSKTSRLNYCGEAVADRDREGLEVGLEGSARELASAFRGSWWESEPNVGRVANGVPARVDRIRGLGNAVVPLQAREAFKRLMGI